MAERARRADTAAKACGAQQAPREVREVILGFPRADFGSQGGRIVASEGCLKVVRRQSGEGVVCESEKRSTPHFFWRLYGGAMLDNFGGFGGFFEAQNTSQNRVDMERVVAGLFYATCVRFGVVLGLDWERFSAALGCRRAVVGCAGDVSNKSQ